MDEIKKFSMSVNKKQQIKQSLDKEKIIEPVKDQGNQKNKKSNNCLKKEILNENLKLMMKEQSKIPHEESARVKSDSKENHQSSEKKLNSSRNSESKSKEKAIVSTKKSKKVVPIVKNITNKKLNVNDKKNFGEVKSKVKTYIEEKKLDNLEEKPSKIESKSKSKNGKEKTKSEIILSKKTKYTQNFCAIDLKKNWKEKVNIPLIRNL